MTTPAKGALRGWTLVRSTVLAGVCSIADLLPGGAAPALSAPSNLVPPSISGGSSEGDTLTAAAGSWSGNPTPTISGQWLADGVAISGATGSSFTTTATQDGKTLTYRESAINSQGGPITALSNAIGPITVPGGLAQPTLTNASALGTSPVSLSWSTTDFTAGLRGQLEIASDSSFTTITQNIVFFVDGESWVLNSEKINLVDPASGAPYYARIRTVRDDDSGITVTGTDPMGNAVSFSGVVSAWSSTFTDTITAASGNTTAYRYYRLYVSAGNNAVLSIGEIEIAATVGGADTTAGMTFTASDQETSLDPGAVANAFDNNAATFYESHISGGATPFPHWIVVDYGATSGNWIAANQLKVTARSNNGTQAPKDFKLQGSADNATWTDIITVTGASAWANGETRTYEA